MVYNLELFISVLEKNIDNRGKTPPLSLTGYPLIEVKHIQEDRLFPVFENTKYVNQETWDTWFRAHLEPGDILFSTVGSIARSCMVPDKPKFCIAQNVLGFRVNRSKADPRFLYYAMSDSFFQHEVYGRTVETVQKSIKVHDLKTCRIPLPSLPEQKAIAHILGTLDDKIELNRRMNETLEAMARAIFKSWFVDFDPVRAKAEGRQPNGMDPETAALFPNSFQDSELGPIPKGWEVDTLNDLAGFVLGGDWGKEQPTDTESESVYCIRGADIPSLQEGGWGKMPIRHLKPASLEKRTLQPGDIVIEISGGSPTQCTARTVLIQIEMLCRLDAPLVCSNFCRLFRPSSKIWSNFVYFSMRGMYERGELSMYETGTTGIKNFGYTIFANSHPLVMPDESTISAFNRLVDPLMALRHAYSTESETLVKLRDILLPKLLSGELTVLGMDQAVAEVGG